MFNKELALIDRLEELEKVEVEEHVAPSAEASNVPAVGSASLNKGSPILSSSEHFPQGRLALEEITAFDAFTTKLFPLPSLLDLNIVS